MTTVLVVDDDETTRTRLKRVIEKEGLPTLLAADGKEGMAIFDRERPDITISDIRMPNIDGMELLGYIKKTDPQKQVVLITGHGDYDLAIQALRAGALDYLRKPIDLDDLFISLGRAQKKIARDSELSHVPRTILLLEDDDTARQRFEKILTKEGYKVITGADGEEGMRRFGETKVDVVLADLKMPKKGGLDVLREVMQITEDVEFIMFTGYGDEETAIAAMRQGALSYIKKPVELEQMLLSVEKAFEKLKLRRSVMYTRRSLQLSEEILMKVTSQKELMIDIQYGKPQVALDFAENLLDALPLFLIVVNAESRVIFTNNAVLRRIGEKPSKISGKVLLELGLSQLSLETFEENMAEVLGNPMSEATSINMGRYGFALFTRFFILSKEGSSKVAVVVMRPEKGISNQPAPEQGTC